MINKIIVLSVRFPRQLRKQLDIFMKLGANIIPLEAITKCTFLVSTISSNMSHNGGETQQTAHK